MSEENDNLLRGILHEKQAVAKAEANNYEAAVQHYLNAATLFLGAMMHDRLESTMRSRIQSKLNNILIRLEEMKEICKSDATHKNVIAYITNGLEYLKDKKNTLERRRLIEHLATYIITNSNVTFADVIGLEQAKEVLKEALILPIKLPEVFQAQRKTCSRFLLYGPPGVGKSYLAKAIAAECQATFISMNSQEFISRYRGHNEKHIQSLFELAFNRQPSIIFIDDIDELCKQYYDTGSEWFQRIKTEFIIQMECFATSNANVFVIAASNMPWILDATIRRRFDKRIYLSLPDMNERVNMFKTHLGDNTYHTIKDHDWMQFAQRSENYSPADIAVVCRDALLRPIRRIMSATHFKRVPNPKSDGIPEVWMACSPQDPNGEPFTYDNLNSDELCEPPVTMDDMLAALVTQGPTVSDVDLMQYKNFMDEFGQEG